MKNAPTGTGHSLKLLRERASVPQPLVAAMAGTTTAYLAKVEDGVLSPANSYVRKVTEAIVRLMQDPPRPCPVLGCDNTHHVGALDGDPGDPKAHHSDLTLRGEDWTIDVRRHDDQDTEWVVYVDIDAAFALSAASFLAVTDAYKQASAYAAVLNRKPATLAS
ncbi:hypothetical protein QP157_06850 [Sphingomonas sp. LR61]|uniref:hypothetical protein n=1 Tax=Sphingomonas sp. LR61 TaxID=3050234 RepID=UPI002FE25D49